MIPVASVPLLSPSHNQGTLRPTTIAAIETVRGQRRPYDIVHDDVLEALHRDPLVRAWIGDRAGELASELLLTTNVTTPVPDVFRAFVD